MKNIILTVSFLVGLSTFAQEHYSGISTSNRVGILNANINPAELVNLSKMFEANIYGVSFNVANNKIGFSDLTSNSNLEDLIFTGTDPVNMRFDTEIIGPSVALRWMKWGFGITTKANMKFDVVDVNPAIGNAINNNDLLSNLTLLNQHGNQKLNSTTYGEVGFSAARTIFENDNHSFGAGLTFKFLFPGSYSNFGLSNLNGEITQDITGAYLTTNSPAIINIAYSGDLADSFSNFDDYTQTVFGSLNGVATDIGFTYEWKNGSKNYKIKGGLSVRNIGSMTFKDHNNQSSTYTFSTQIPGPLDLSLFQGYNNLTEVEDILNTNGYLTQTAGEKDFKVNLPTLLTVYGDFKIIPKIYVTGYLQRKINDNSSNGQITAMNVFSVTPRINLGFFESYMPISNNDISGTSVGLGFRLGGFYIGSSAILTALTSDSKQADLYTGFRWAFL